MKKNSNEREIGENRIKRGIKVGNSKKYRQSKLNPLTSKYIGLGRKKTTNIVSNNTNNTEHPKTMKINSIVKGCRKLSDQNKTILEKTIKIETRRQ